MKNKKIVYSVAIILVIVLAATLFYVFRPANKQITKKPKPVSFPQTRESRKAKQTKPEKPPGVKTYKQEVITVADAGEGEKDVGIAKGGGEGELSVGPSNIAVDKDENIYISDVYNGLIKKYDKNGKFIKNIQSLIYPWQTLVNDEDNIYVFSGGTKVYKINQSGDILLKYEISIPDVRWIMLIKNLIYASVYVWPDTSSEMGLSEGSYVFKIGTTEKAFNTKQQRKSLIKGGQLAEDGKIYSFAFIGNQIGIEIKDKNQKLLKKFKVMQPRSQYGSRHFLKITKDKIFISDYKTSGYTIQVFSKDGDLLAEASPFASFEHGFFGWDTLFISAVFDNETIYVMDATLDTKKDAFKILKLTLEKEKK